MPAATGKLLIVLRDWLLDCLAPVVVPWEAGIMAVVGVWGWQNGRMLWSGSVAWTEPCGQSTLCRYWGPQAFAMSRRRVDR